MNKRARRFWRAVGALAIVIAGSVLLVRWYNAARLNAAFPAERQQILANGDSFILYSLQPSPNPEAGPGVPKGKPAFHGFQILGQTQLKSDASRKALLNALYETAGRGYPAACFNPRHGIRAIQGKKSVDLVICFHCEQILIYDEHGESSTTVGNTTQPVFDRVLTLNNLPLADQ